MTRYIDTRDLATELDELEARQDAVEAVTDDPEATDDDRAELDPLDEDEAIRLAELRNLESEIGSEFRYGETMIPVEDFVDYAEELAGELGYMNDKRANDWPFRHIDWEAAANELKADYTEVSWEGQDYYVRAS